MWDKPGTNSAPGRFYEKIRKNFEDEVKFIQLSAYGTKTFESAGKLAELAEHYGLHVLIFRVTEELNVGEPAEKKTLKKLIKQSNERIT